MALPGSSSLGPLRTYFAVLELQAGLAAGAEVSVTASWVLPLPRTFGLGAGKFIMFAQVGPQTNEANVEYVVQIDKGNCSQTTAAVKVRNAGTANGAQSWTLSVVCFDQTDLMQ